MPHVRDAAFNFGQWNPPLQHSEWKWNNHNPNTQSQVPTLYNPNHIYHFYFQGGLPQTFSFSELQASWYNDNNGKDHWSITSFLAMGPGIQGGRVIGATDDYQAPYAVDPGSMSLSDSGTRIHPAHIHSALRQLAGIDKHPVITAWNMEHEALPLWGS